MKKAPPLREIFDPPDEIVQAGPNGDLVFFVGAGASMLLGLPSWSELAGKALEDLRNEKFLNFAEIEQLKKLDPRKQLSIACSIAKQNEFELNLVKHLTGKSEGDSIYKAINDMGCPCVTTNYDELLAPRYIEDANGSATALPVTRVFEPEKFFADILVPGTVVHLHGAIRQPKSMIITTKEYLRHYDHENVKHFLGELFATKTILFLGYGLEEAEILEHILRRGSAAQTSDRRRFALQGYFLGEQPLYEKLHNYYENSFGVHLLGFVRDREDYNCLETIIKTWVSQIEIRKPPLAQDYAFMAKVLKDD